LRERVLRAVSQATVCLFGGAALMWLIDAAVHSLDASHDAAHNVDPRQFVAESIGSVGEVATVVQRGASAAQDVGDVEAVSSSFSGGPAAADDASSSADSASPEGGPPPEGEPAAHAVAKGASPSSAETTTTTSAAEQHSKKLKEMGLKTALAIGFHNFPEGLATFVATIASPSVGVALAIAIAIHNIPEGLCVAMPIYFSTGDRLRAFKWALWSGASEPIGAALGWLILANVVNQLVYGILFGVVGGMMIMIVMHELLPTAHRYDPEDKYVTKFFTLGMAVMAASLVLFTYG